MYLYILTLCMCIYNACIQITMLRLQRVTFLSLNEFLGLGHELINQVSLFTILVYAAIHSPYSYILQYIHHTPIYCNTFTILLYTAIHSPYSYILQYIHHTPIYCNTFTILLYTAIHSPYSYILQYIHHTPI